MPGAARDVPDPFAARESERRAARTGTGAVRSRDGLDAPGDKSPLARRALQGDTPRVEADNPAWASPQAGAVRALPVADTVTDMARARKHDTDLGNRLALPCPSALCRHRRWPGWVADGGRRGEEDEQA
jgi:hypothetical protein